KDKKIPEGSYITEQGNMTTDTPVQFLKLPETEKSDNQVHNVPLIPIPSPKPKVTEFQTTTQKIVPVPTRKPWLNAEIAQYLIANALNTDLKLTPLNDTNSYNCYLLYCIFQAYFSHCIAILNFREFPSQRYLFGEIC
ncbi:MAG: hypothetical protein IJS88_06745, partial [Alphaproteobacteria bacterium]|nr:hypothetical protein [Alphaproteobacteria bacterium]